MSLTKRDVKKHAKAITRSRLQAKERHAHQQGFANSIPLSTTHSMTSWRS